MDAPTATPPPAQNTPEICPQCHQPVSGGWYYCSNCGKNLKEAPLPVSINAQGGLYIHAIILPSLCFLSLRYWPAFKYARSSDPKTKNIGYIAIALMVISTFMTYWLAAVWINHALDSAWGTVDTMQGF